MGSATERERYGLATDSRGGRMGCLLILLALLSPRFALVVLWLFTNEVDRAYDNPWIPVLGFVFLPWTTFVYALAWAPGGPSTLGWVFVALALLADLTSWVRTLDRRALRRHDRV